MTALATTTARGPSQLGRGQTAVAIFPPDREGGPPITALVKQTGNGLVRNTLARIRLDPDKAETWSLRAWNPSTKQYERKQSITATGYNKINQFLGVSFFTPERIIDDDGRVTSNPYFHRDEHGEIVFVKVRMIGLGRNATGNLVAHDLTVTYNLRTYFAQDLYSKWTGKKDEATRDWGVLMPMQFAKPDSTHLVVPIAGGSALVVDLKSKDVVYALGEHLNRQKFAERNAQTICQRNILKKFTGLQVVTDNFVSVVSWVQPDRDFITIGRKVSEAQEGRIIIDDEPVDLQREAATVEDKEDVDEALGGDFDDDMPPPDEGPGENNDVPGSVAASSPAPTKPQAPQQSEAAQELVTKIRDVCEHLDGNAVDTVVNQLGYDEWRQLAAEVDVAKLQAALAEFKRASAPQQQAANRQGQLPLKQPPARTPRQR